ncbi:PutA1 [Desulforapulum autotrophicum HRM2]|uniref:proline dehydrogenase n=1 Tax=Desulforapulum autotrophicum (strain ATCC 43914 / DSM 3382 / VKM B-1955 / HRM2) TaxID=177437 RepID=C0QM52_DESAH|nr:proline dehydrogenase family protein [Desulforapulum autotrophicum]ACN14358.1 PutA1 [Desulforapulum autotrophicum HRM2]
MLNSLMAKLIPFFPEKLVWIFSKRYIAGIDVNDALAASRDLNNQGAMVTLDLLGEFISTMDEAKKNTQDYLDLMDALHGSGINGNLSVKPTMFGLLLDKEACFSHVREIVQRAAGYNSFIRIDMEDASCTSMEIEIFRRLKVEFPGHVGLVLQAYLKRTPEDITGLMDLHTPEAPLNFRLCKGIYVEPATIAFKQYDQINRAYVENLEFMFKNKIHAAVATHDALLVEKAFELIEQYKVPKALVEFQMLFGVTPKLRQTIIDRGFPMRVYVPFGKEWFGYSTRRLKENPAMVQHIIKALFMRG